MRIFEFLDFATRIGYDEAMLLYIYTEYYDFETDAWMELSIFYRDDIPKIVKIFMSTRNCERIRKKLEKLGYIVIKNNINNRAEFIKITSAFKNEY